MLVALSFAHAGLLIAVSFESADRAWPVVECQHHLAQLRSSAVLSIAGLNWVYAIYLTVLLSIPHSIWRDRHLRHHSGRDRLVSMDPERRVRNWPDCRVVDRAGIDGFTFLRRCLPAGVSGGAGLCQLQGHFEHARGTTSHYGRLYN